MPLPYKPFTPDRLELKWMLAERVGDDKQVVREKEPDEDLYDFIISGRRDSFYILLEFEINGVCLPRFWGFDYCDIDSSLTNALVFPWNIGKRISGYTILNFKSLCNEPFTREEARVLYERCNPAASAEEIEELVDLYYRDEEVYYYMERQHTPLYCCAMCGDPRCPAWAVAVSEKDGHICWYMQDVREPVFEKQAYLDAFREYRLMIEKAIEMQNT